ncbi:MAG: PrsW family glutamic-type intramembrane protease [Verrucomicrobiales bacterium]
MPLPSQQLLARLSRDRGFLVRASLLMVAVALAIAFFSSLAFGPRLSAAELLEIIEAETETPTTVKELISLVRFGDPSPEEPRLLDCRNILRDPRRTWTEEEIDEFAAKLPQPTGSDLIAPWWKGLRGEDRETAVGELLAISPEVPYRNEFLGDLHFLEGDWTRAMEAFAEEVNRFGASTYSRRSAVVLASRERQLDRLESVLEDPEFDSFFEPKELLEIYSESRRFGALGLATLKAELDMLRSPYLAPALFTAAIWFLIFMAFWTPTPVRLAAAGLAFVAGAVSAVLTLYFAVVQENVQGFAFNPQDTAIAQFLHLVAGVALREETLKLLCFLPFAFWAGRRKSGLEAILLAGIVGLGFAFQENLQYFQSGAGSYVAWARLLTANALHYSLTGVAGLYLYRMVSRRMRGWEEFLACFLAVVLAHGVYNAVLSMPDLIGYSPLSVILVALIAYRFFDPLREQMETRGIGQRVSPLGIFVLGSVVLTCLVLIASATMQPFRFALGAFASSVGGLVPLAFAFISRFRDL